MTRALDPPHRWLAVCIPQLWQSARLPPWSAPREVFLALSPPRCICVQVDFVHPSKPECSRPPFQYQLPRFFLLRFECRLSEVIYPLKHVGSEFWVWHHATSVSRRASRSPRRCARCVSSSD